MTDGFVLDLAAIDRHRVADVGGKAANLGELTRVAGVAVPAGRVVTTAAFRRFVAATPALPEQVERLADLDPADAAALATRCAEVRALIAASPVPDDVGTALAAALD